MAPDLCGGLRNSPSSAKSRHVLKKGPWTTAEDMMLLEYVKKHGEGNWNAVQRNSGLLRCGKSCRLRWANHLRPNLKKGAFTADEEKIIVDLHAKLGNKWARMAAHLPGRTDNEIKNYWNTRLKRRQRAGLPIYPHELQQREQTLNSSSSQTLSLSSLLPPTRPQNPNPFTFGPSMISPQRHTPYINYYNNNNDGLSLSLDASNSSFSSPFLPAAPFFSAGLPVTPLVQYNSMSYGSNVGPEMGVLELPSIQSPGAAASSSEFLVAATSGDGAEEYEVGLGFGEGNRSGLLEDLFEESQALGHGEKIEAFVAEGGSEHEEGEAFGYGIANSGDDCKGSGPEAKASREGITAMDEEVMKLLDNFPLSVPIPDWNGGDGSESPILTDGTNRAAEGRFDAPVVVATSVDANQSWSYGSCLWNNMPTIY